MSKLTHHDRREINRLANLGFSNLYLAARFGVTQRTITQIRRGQWDSGSAHKLSAIRGLRTV